MSPKERALVEDRLPAWRMGTATCECAAALDGLLQDLDKAARLGRRQDRLVGLLRDRNAMLLARLEQIEDDLRACEERGLPAGDAERGDAAEGPGGGA